MTNFDTISVKTADEVLTGFRTVLASTELNDTERDAYHAGFLMGITYALAAHRENNIHDAARTLIALYHEYAQQP